MREKLSHTWIFLVAIFVLATLLGINYLLPRNEMAREVMRFEGYLHVKSNSNSHKWNVTLSIREISGDLKGEFYIENNKLLKKDVYEVESVTVRETMLILRISGIDVILERSELGEGVANPTWTSYVYREKQCVVLTWYRGKNINPAFLGLHREYDVGIDLIPAFWRDQGVEG